MAVDRFRSQSLQRPSATVIVAMDLEASASSVMETDASDIAGSVVDQRIVGVATDYRPASAKLARLVIDSSGHLGTMAAKMAFSRPKSSVPHDADQNHCENAHPRQRAGFVVK